MFRREALLSFLLVAAATSTSEAFAIGSPSAFSVKATSALSMSAVAAPEALQTYEKAMERMKAKDKTSKALSKEDLKIVFEDEHLLVVDKPAGVLSVPDGEGNPSLAQAVFDSYGCESGNIDKMVAHRLGFDTTGLVVFARTNVAISSLNMQLRTQKITRQYEALVCGSVSEDTGDITYPLTRDADSLPYMRVYTEDAQRKLIEMADALPKELSAKLCQNEKLSCTKYSVIGREELSGHAVTRLSLTSVSGRTHQLNVHCAAMGHPIVGDSVYGINGDASPNGGLAEDALPASRASDDLQKEIHGLGKDLCVHLQKLTLKHPLTGEQLEFESKSPF